MGKSNAERQAEYRARRPYEGPGGNGERRLNTWVSTGALLALERMSRRYGITRKEMLEKLIMAEAVILAVRNASNTMILALLSTNNRLVLCAKSFRMLAFLA